MALRRLSLEAEASERFGQILSYSQELLRQNPSIDYFATSLPTMLLFNENLADRNRIDATFLEAQARLGLCDSDRGLRLLLEVLSLDPSHTAAADLIDELESEIGQSATRVPKNAIGF